MKITTLLREEKIPGRRHVIPVRDLLIQILRSRPDEVFWVAQLAALTDSNSSNISQFHIPVLAKAGMARRIAGRMYVGTPRALANLEKAIRRAYEIR